MLKYVAYRTYKKLSCSTCDSQIILQIKPEYALGGINFLNSIIAKEQKQTESATGKSFWYYEFTYDDTEQLVPGHPTLYQDDILGVACKSVLTEYFDFLTAQATESVDRKYFPAQKQGPTSEVGIIDGVAIPVVLTTLNTVTDSFINTDTKPVWVTVFYESPIIALTLVSGAGISFDYDYIITNNGVEVLNTGSVPLGGRRNEGPDDDYISWAAGMSQLGCFKVEPGQEIEMTTTLKLNPSGPSAAGNQVFINGPWINMNIAPADIA